MPWKRHNATNRGKFTHNRSLIYTYKFTNCPTTASSVTQVSVLCCHNSATPLCLVFWFLSGSLLGEGFYWGHAPREEGRANHTTTQTVMEMPNLCDTSPTTMLESQKEPILSTSNGQRQTLTSGPQQPQTWGWLLTDQAIKDSLWNSLLLHMLGKVEEYLNIFRVNDVSVQ